MCGYLQKPDDEEYSNRLICIDPHWTIFSDDTKQSLKETIGHADMDAGDMFERNKVPFPHFGQYKPLLQAGLYNKLLNLYIFES